MPMLSGRPMRLVLAATALTALSWLHPAFAVHAAIGTPVANLEMPLAAGGKAFALKDVEANVLVFFRPNQDRSVAALRELARCQAEFSGKSVQWTGIVSGSAPLDRAASMLREAGFTGPLLQDTGDVLYGSLGLALHPVVVIVGRDRKLAAFEPFRSVDFCPVVAARIHFVLHEMSEQQLQEALAPAKSTQGGTVQAARRYAALAEALLRDQQYDKALASARKSLERDATVATAHLLLGRILAAQGHCAEAIQAFEQALAIDAASASAREGLASCKAGR